jgi:hypothetical protein
MKTTAEPIPFAGSTLGGYRHVCAFFQLLQEVHNPAAIRARWHRTRRAREVNTLLTSFASLAL